METKNIEKLENLSTKLRILNQILVDIKENGIIAPSLERELVDNDLFDVVELINGTPRQETINIILKKIESIKQQIKEIVK